MPDVLSEDGATIDVDDATWAVLSDTLGWGYKWGGEQEGEVDCSGYLSLVLGPEWLGLTDGTRYTVATLEAATDPVAVGEQQPGDIAFYRGRHAMAVVSYPRADIGGHSHVMGASGGSSTIQGYDPTAPGYSSKARVKLFRTAKYRPDFVGYRRLRVLRSAPLGGA